MAIGIEGEGTVTPGAGKHTFRKDTVVNLKAVPDEGWLFGKWVGPVKETGSASTTVTMDKNADVTAVFLEADEVIKEPGPVKVVLTIASKAARVNDAEHLLDAAPFIENGRTFVPVRFIAETFGAEADWSPKEGLTETVTLTKGSMVVTLTIGFPVITITENGTVRTVTADVAAQIVNGRTYLPLRAVGEIFGATFDWRPKESRTEWVSLMLK